MLPAGRVFETPGLEQKPLNSGLNVPEKVKKLFSLLTLRKIK